MNVSDTERRRTLQLNMLIGMTALAFLTVFGSNAYLAERYPMAGNLFALAVWGLLCLVAMQRSNDPRYGTYGLSIAAIYTFFYVLASGGAEGTGPLWCYPLVVIITFLMGLRWGSVIVVGMLMLASILLFAPSLPFDIAQYPTSFKIRFLASFLALAIMSLIYEHLRGKSQARFEQISERLDAASRKDELTGLANRRQMGQLIEAEHARFRQQGGAFSVIMADLDHFKQINDRYGHKVGDELLIAVARRFSAALRTADCVARWGGEEFLVLLPQTSASQAALVAEKLRTLIASIDLSRYGVDHPVTASFGLQSIDRARDIDDLVNQADHYLYQAKRLGRNRVATPDSGTTAATARGR